MLFNLLTDGRVTGAIKFGWADARGAVAEVAVDGVSWVLIQFDQRRTKPERQF